VAILANADEAAAVSAKLAELGGKPDRTRVGRSRSGSQTVAAEAPAEVAEARLKRRSQRQSKRKAPHRPPPDRWRLHANGASSYGLTKRELMDDPGRRRVIRRLAQDRNCGKAYTCTGCSTNPVSR